MPRFKVLVVERWAKYHKVEIEAPDRWEAGTMAEESVNENSDVDFDAASEAGLDFIELENLGVVDA